MTASMFRSGLPRALALLGAGALAAQIGPALWEAAAEAERPVLWWAGRSTGFVAYLALWLSMLFGALVSAKGVDGMLGRKAMMELHQQWTLAAVLTTAAHALAIVAHEESHVRPLAALVPYASATLTGPVALGTFALWGMAVLAASSWLRRHLPYAAWRALHGIAFGVFVLALVHSVTAGTDSGHALVRVFYLGTASLLVGTVVTRAALALGGRRKREGKVAPLQREAA